MELVTKDADYFALRNEFAALTIAFQNSSYVLPGSVDSWYDAFRARTLLAGELTVPATSAAFFAAVHGFVNSAQGERFASSIVFNTDNSSIQATRVGALFAASKGIKDEIDAMDAVRKVCDDVPSMKAIAYTYPMLFWEGLRVVETEIIRNVGLAAACVFFVCWAVLKSLPAAAIVLFVIAMIDVCLLGSMHIVGDAINMVTAINLLLAIGLCIDYSAHVVHAFLEAEGTRDERAATALNVIGLSVFNGGMSTFFATLTMFTAKSYIFQVFGRMFVLIVLWGLYFGIVVLPVLLSLIGPLSHKTYPTGAIVQPAIENEGRAQPSPSVSDEKAVSAAASVPNLVL